MARQAEQACEACTTSDAEDSGGNIGSAEHLCATSQLLCLTTAAPDLYGHRFASFLQRPSPSPSPDLYVLLAPATGQLPGPMAYDYALFGYETGREVLAITMDSAGVLSKCPSVGQTCNIVAQVSRGPALCRRSPSEARRPSFQRFPGRCTASRAAPSASRHRLTRRRSCCRRVETQPRMKRSTLPSPPSHCRTASLSSAL